MTSADRQEEVLNLILTQKCANVKELSAAVYASPATIRRDLRVLESKGFVTRERSKSDERLLLVSLTEEGIALKQRAVHVPAQVGSCVPLEAGEAAELYRLLYKVLGAK